MAKCSVHIFLALIAFANCKSPLNPVGSIQQAVNTVAGATQNVVNKAANVATTGVNTAVNVGDVAIESGIQGTGQVVGALGNAVGDGFTGAAGVIGAIGGACENLGNLVADATLVNTVTATVEQITQKPQVKVPRSSAQFPSSYSFRRSVPLPALPPPGDIPLHGCPLPGGIPLPGHPPVDPYLEYPSPNGNLFQEGYLNPGYPQPIYQRPGPYAMTYPTVHTYPGMVPIQFYGHNLNAVHQQM